MHPTISCWGKKQQLLAR